MWRVLIGGAGILAVFLVALAIVGAWLERHYERSPNERR